MHALQQGSIGSGRTHQIGEGVRDHVLRVAVRGQRAWTAAICVTGAWYVGVEQVHSAIGASVDTTRAGGADLADLSRHVCLVGGCMTGRRPWSFHNWILTEELSTTPHFGAWSALGCGTLGR